MSGQLDERQFIEAAAESAAGKTAAIARDSRLQDGSLEDYTSHRSLRDLLWTLLPEPTTDGILLLPPKNAVLLAGPRGSGKRNLAGTFLAWASGAGCRCFSVDRFLASLVPEDRLPDYLAKLMSSAGNTPLAAVIDAGSGEHRERTDSREHRRPDPLLSAAAAAFSRVPEELSLTLILTSSDPDAPRDLDLPGLLVLPVGRPGKKEREEFFAEHRNRMPRRSETAAGGASSQEAGRGNTGGSAQPAKLPSYEWLAENTDGLNYDGLNQVLRIVRMKLKLSALTTFGNAREVREAADPAAREAAMRDLFIYALNGSAFWYSEDMFLEAVKMVREAEAASAGDVILSGMSPAVPPRPPYSGTPERNGGDAGDITGRNAGYGGYSPAAARELFADAGDPGGTDIGSGSYAGKIRAAVPGDDEDALAYADLMEDLHIPPDPRKKQQ